MRPLNDNIHVLRPPPASKVGGIVLPEQAKKQVPYGLVLGVGEDAKGKVKVGEVVLFDLAGTSSIIREDRERGMLLAVAFPYVHSAMSKDEAEAMGYEVSEAGYDELIAFVR